MDAISIILFGIGMFLSGKLWDQVKVYPPDDGADAPGTGTPSRKE